MPKTGWKYTKQMPSKGSVNMLKKSGASSKVGRVVKATKGGKNQTHLRSNDTIRRLKMYETGKAVRNKEGKIVGGQFMMKDRAGDTEITSTTGRIAPDRRWFGNTRVVDSKTLEEFRQQMLDSQSDPYSVVLKRKKLPMGLLREAANMASADNNRKDALLANEPFEHTFGSKSRRKRVKLEQLFVSRDEERQTKQSLKELKKKGSTSTIVAGGEGGKTEALKKGDADDDDETTRKDKDTTTTTTTNNNSEESIEIVVNNSTSNTTAAAADKDGYGALLKAAQQSHKTYEEINNADGIVPWGRDENIERNQDWIPETKADLFLKGQSRRIWGELWKVVDCSDVVLHVIDARHPEGTRCRMLEHHLSKNASHKHLVFVLNKIDLVPNWVAKRWVGELSKDRPTIAFHASQTQAFGKGALISLLRQFSKLSDKKQISVGIIGYPNVGKSSIINTLVGKKNACKVAPIPGETKLWQYVTLMKRIYLIDSPGVVVDTAGDTETDSVLKGVVRSERLETPQDFVDAILQKVKREHVAAQYGLQHKGDETWKSSEHLLELIALKSGRLKKGGEPCLRSSAITLINDYQRGRLPHYEAPPELKEEDSDHRRFNNMLPELSVKQNLDDIVEQKMVSATEEVDDINEATIDNKNDPDTKKRKRDDNNDDDDNHESDNEEEQRKDDDSDDDESLPPVVLATAAVGGGDWDDDDDDNDE